MASPNFEIREFVPQAATDTEWLAWNHVTNVMRKETSPEDPPITVRQSQESATSTPSHIVIRRWGVWRGEALLGRAWVQISETGENRHAAWFGIQMLPEHRCQGHGRGLLAHVVAAAERWNRTLMMSGSTEEVPAGEAFFRRIGAQPALRMTLNQLDLATRDEGLLEQWRQCLCPEEQGLIVDLWRGPYAEENFADVIAMKEATNLMPRGELELNDDHLTVEELREYNRQLLANRVERLTLVLRDRASGGIAGYTEMFRHPDQPLHLGQGDTAVFPQFQNRGLGRWLKATMLQLAIEEWPEAVRVRTGNASSNAPMLKINHAMGFRTHLTDVEWQIETARVRQYLEG